MFIVDFSQVVISNMMVSLGNYKDMPIDIFMFRHMVLNTLKSLNLKFRDEYGEMIIVTDDSSYWRKDIFPYYKHRRKEKQKESTINWKQIFEYLNILREEIRDNFKYKVIHVPHAEADDIIATLVGLSQKTLIVSKDNDFIQLHSKIVKQYDPIGKKFISHPNPLEHKQMHIIKGESRQSGDGIPNILSPDDCFVTRVRQKPITEKMLSNWIGKTKEEICGDNKVMLHRYNRNEKLIDLNFIPENIKNETLDQYYKQSNKNNSKLLDYFISKKLKHLTESISDFR